MFVTNWISTIKIQKISEITNFFRHYFLSRTEVYYWGIKCLSQRICKNVQGKLKDIVLNSKYGFHNNEENAPEWVVSDYASESDIVERFVTLTSIIIQQPEVILCQ